MQLFIENLIKLIHSSNIVDVIAEYAAWTQLMHDGK